MTDSTAANIPYLPAVVLGPGEGELFDYGDGDASLVLAPGAATDGAFSVVEHRLGARAAGPPLHRHERLCDSFYVLEGVLTLRVKDRTVQAPPGSYACFPPGVAHTFRNDTDTVVRVLNINAPGGWDEVLRALLAASADGTVESDEVGRIAAQRDMIVLE